MITVKKIFLDWSRKGGNPIRTHQARANTERGNWKQINKHRGKHHPNQSFFFLFFLNNVNTAQVLLTIIRHLNNTHSLTLPPLPSSLSPPLSPLLSLSLSLSYTHSHLKVGGKKYG